jgi:hypothetical protein
MPGTYDSIPTRQSLVEMRRHQSNMTGGDDTLAYAQTGEIVIPVEIQKKYPTIAMAALSAIKDAGGNPSQYVVGSQDGNYHDKTGAQQFNWLSNTVDWLANNRVGQAAISGLGSAAIAKLTGASGKQALATGLGSGLGYYAGDMFGDYLSNNQAQKALTADLEANKINQQSYDTQLAALKNPTAYKSSTVGEAFGNLGSEMFGNKMALTGAGLGGTVGYALAPTPKVNIPQFDPNAPSTLTNIPTSTAPDVLNTIGANEAANVSAVVPQDLPIAPTTPQGINYLSAVRNRDTGQMEYVNDTSSSPFSRAVNEMSSRRGGFGSRMIL